MRTRRVRRSNPKGATAFWVCVVLSTKIFSQRFGTAEKNRERKVPRPGHQIKEELIVRGVQLRTVLKFVLIARCIAPQAAIKESK